MSALDRLAVGEMRSVLVVQGEHRVTGESDVLLTTLLGSCIATCLHDPVAKVGGMNHFLVADGGSSSVGAERYGLYAMEVLINGLLKLGGDKRRLQAKVFGGAAMTTTMGQIGAANISFARDFLKTEKINIVAEDVGGRIARRVRYCPSTGRASLLHVENSADPDLTVSRRPKIPPTDVTLF
ncbi:Chemoreceptor glutamine deamidase CheD [Roseivivax sp. THAF40]|uniref:chemotaxis protein CheD n=1 Tax=unclassified Roseivivax TaxID=2639302 RepID=UPI0012A8ABD3|nr:MULTISPECIES: chemotaxis protein CheD [unclassified Roseivivax]QFS83208.1 Chemoreceptor glutamine deamidase CheD [Roseivivax sp. THAF197b]QFT46952.1 Chemoreceptor glutamine deamidase CheD [Roseivivax sp. THAF40]